MDRGPADARHALRTIGELVAGRVPGAQAATAKLYATVQHQRLLELAAELLAEEATVTGDDYELEPLLRAFLMSRAETIYGGSSQPAPAQHHRRANPRPAQGTPACGRKGRPWWPR